MSGPSTAPPEAPRLRPPPSLIALVAAVLYVALIVGSYGFIRLVTHRDVITNPDTSTLVGPVMVAVTAALVFLVVLRGTARTIPRLPVRRATLTALAVWAIGPAVGGMLYAGGRSEPFAAITFFFRYLGSPYIVCSAVVAFAVVLLAPFLDRPPRR